MSIRNQYRNWRLRKHVEKFGSKNNGHFNYFNREWFEEYQTTLIFLLNHWLLKFWFRWILRIHKDCKFDEVIDKIEPHTYRIKVGENTYRSDFRTHQKFSKRIYYAFRPYWYLLHALDFVIQRIVAPDFSFGFDTLTTYPDADPETTTVDGSPYVSSPETDFGSLRSMAGNAQYADNLTYMGLQLNAGSSQDTFTVLARLIILFDTSALTSLATISQTNLQLTYDSMDNTLDICPIDIVTSNPTSNTSLLNTDFNISKFGTVSFASVTMGYPTTTWDFNADGNGAISKSGITKLGARYKWDLDNVFLGTWSNLGQNLNLFKTADNTGTTQDPKLVVTYTLPATGNKFQMVV